MYLRIFYRFVDGLSQSALFILTQHLKDFPGLAVLGSIDDPDPGTASVPVIRPPGLGIHRQFTEQGDYLHGKAIILFKNR